jgi:hypothetical protein
MLKRWRERISIDHLGLWLLTPIAIQLHRAIRRAINQADAMTALADRDRASCPAERLLGRNPLLRYADPNVRSSGPTAQSGQLPLTSIGTRQCGSIAFPSFYWHGRRRR